ncbi:MAG: potassium/proton antiporter [Syntrophomonadaceae bacterium]|jgi:cell volume regulation protein A|nr:potassium/proton antiporter [Syntrophomonadaceae bacterium]
MEQFFDTDHLILLIALLLIVGVLVAKFSARLGVPALVLFILAGMAAGSDGLGLIYFDNVQLTQTVGMLALIIIIFEGGLQTKWTTVKPVAVPSIFLASIGVLITSLVVAVAAKFVLGITWFEGFLFGAIVSSTDAAAVFAVLKGQNLRERLKATLEFESGSNDPMAVLLTLTFVELLLLDKSYANFWLIGSFFWQMGIASILGFVMGKLAAMAINKINLDSSGLYPVFVLAFALLTYSLTSLVGASGLLAVYVSALVIGNSEIAFKHSIFGFNEGFAWIMQILMFMILGLLVFPTQLFVPNIMLNGLLLSAVLMFFARPVAVFISTIKMGFSLKEKFFLSWAGLKGAVPIVLATYPLTAGLENSHLFFNVVFFVVLTSALIQGSSIMLFAEKLKLTIPKRVESPHSLELISIGKANAEIIEFQVCEANDITGKALANITFPKDVLVTAIIRSGQLITPTGITKVEAGDILYILMDKKSKKELIELLNNLKADFEDVICTEQM